MYKVGEPETYYLASKYGTGGAIVKKLICFQQRIK